MGCATLCENLEATYRCPIFTHSMEVKTFTIDRGPPTLAMSIASRRHFVRHSDVYVYIYIYMVALGSCHPRKTLKRRGRRYDFACYSSEPCLKIEGEDSMPKHKHLERAVIARLLPPGSVLLGSILFVLDFLQPSACMNIFTCLVFGTNRKISKSKESYKLDRITLGVPQIRVPLVIMHFNGIVPYKPSIRGGTSIYGNTH